MYILVQQERDLEIVRIGTTVSRGYFSSVKQKPLRPCAFAPLR